MNDLCSHLRKAFPQKGYAEVFDLLKTSLAKAVYVCLAVRTAQSLENGTIIRLSRRNEVCGYWYSLIASDVFLELCQSFLFLR